MMDNTQGLDESPGAAVPVEDLRSITEAFDLGEVVEGPDYLPAGLMNRNWRLESKRGCFALKQVRDTSAGDADRNLAAVSHLASDGVPVCAPVATVSGGFFVDAPGGRYCLTDWVDGHHILGNDLELDGVRRLGGVLGQIHQGLRTAAPKAGFPEAPAQMKATVTDAGKAAAEAERFQEIIARSPVVSAFDRRVSELLDQRLILLDKYASSRPKDEVARGPFGWTHGDFQHLNVLWGDTGEVSGVLDWDRIRVRPFGEEVARSATLLFGTHGGGLDLERVAAFVAGYRTEVEVRGEELADAVERLWWKRMCDYWHLEFHYDRDDHSCDHLFFSASDFLAWWCGHREDVVQAFTAG
ncbi:phosphotransferase [Nocardiopsis tropica]|uniref:Phosphotransferase n=1 Tax=Nocardiopsis tropica TaxID=109330 RepID=A0ABU7KJX4_9ACTN|nr:phosphotransferase [Nocardiopsis umidischolae]MEE2049600.1 phosphotransferase [Nocardiopsis umidischolae]